MFRPEIRSDMSVVEAGMVQPMEQRESEGSEVEQSQDEESEVEESEVEMEDDGSEAEVRDYLS